MATYYFIGWVPFLLPNQHFWSTKWNSEHRLEPGRPPTGPHYLHQGGYIFVIVCLSVCLLANLLKNVQTDLHEIFWQGWQWTSEQTVKFWRQSRSWIRIRIHIVTMVRRALAEVWSVPVLLVMVALCNRADHALWFLSSFFFFPRLISAAVDWMSTILPHMVWP